MKQPFSKREKIAAGVGIFLVIGVVGYIMFLYSTLQSKDTVIENNSALLRKKEVDANTTANYIETICAEYRKLYQSYREVRYSDPASVDKYAGLPGSAKGQIDECYLPD